MLQYDFQLVQNILALGFGKSLEKKSFKKHKSMTDSIES